MEACLGTRNEILPVSLITMIAHDSALGISLTQNDL